MTDKILQYLVDKVEETGMGFSITLIVRGLIVEGNLIRSAQYFDALSKLLDDIKENMGDDVDGAGDLIETEIFDKFNEDYKSFLKSRIRNKQEEDREYVHLNESVIYQSGLQPYGPNLWRGRISSVDGFSMGRRSSSTTQS